jgi:hypothetical protein
MIKNVCDLRQVGGFLWFPPPLTSNSDLYHFIRLSAKDELPLMWFNYTVNTHCVYFKWTRGQAFSNITWRQPHLKQFCLNIDILLLFSQGPSWPRSYGSWIYNYLCNKCLSPLMLIIIVYQYLNKIVFPSIIFYSRWVKWRWHGWHMLLMFTDIKFWLVSFYKIKCQGWATIDVVFNISTLVLLEVPIQ